MIGRVISTSAISEENIFTTNKGGMNRRPRRRRRGGRNQYRARPENIVEGDDDEYEVDRVSGIRRENGEVRSSITHF